MNLRLIFGELLLINLFCTNETDADETLRYSKIYGNGMLQCAHLTHSKDIEELLVIHMKGIFNSGNSLFITVCKPFGIYRTDINNKLSGIKKMKHL